MQSATHDVVYEVVEEYVGTQLLDDRAALFILLAGHAGLRSKPSPLAAHYYVPRCEQRLTQALASGSCE